MCSFYFLLEEKFTSRAGISATTTSAKIFDASGDDAVSLASSTNEFFRTDEKSDDDSLPDNNKSSVGELHSDDASELDDEALKELSTKPSSTKKKRKSSKDPSSTKEPKKKRSLAESDGFNAFMMSLARQKKTIN